MSTSRGWHKLIMDAAHNKSAVQVYPGLASSLWALCVFPFATSSSGNSMARKNAFHSLTSEILKFASYTAQGCSASCPPTPSTVSTATIQHIYEDYKGGLTEPLCMWHISYAITSKWKKLNNIFRGLGKASLLPLYMRGGKSLYSEAKAHRHLFPDSVRPQAH